MPRFSTRGAKIGSSEQKKRLDEHKFVKAAKKKGHPVGGLLLLVLAYFLIKTLFVSVNWPSSKIFNMYSPDVINEEFRL